MDFSQMAQIVFGKIECLSTEKCLYPISLIILHTGSYTRFWLMPFDLDPDKL